MLIQKYLTSSSWLAFAQSQETLRADDSEEMDRDRRFLNLIASQSYPTMAVYEAYQAPIMSSLS